MKKFIYSILHLNDQIFTIERWNDRLNEIEISLCQSGIKAVCLASLKQREKPCKNVFSVQDIFRTPSKRYYRIITFCEFLTVQILIPRKVISKYHLRTEQVVIKLNGAGNKTFVFLSLSQILSKFITFWYSYQQQKLVIGSSSYLVFFNFFERTWI